MACPKMSRDGRLNNIFTLIPNIVSDPLNLCLSMTKSRSAQFHPSREIF